MRCQAIDAFAANPTNIGPTFRLILIRDAFIFKGELAENSDRVLVHQPVQGYVGIPSLLVNGWKDRRL